MKSLRATLTVFFVFLITSTTSALTEQEYNRHKLLKTDQNLSRLFKVMNQVHGEISDIRYQSRSENINNFIKVYVKGALDVSTRLNAPSNLNDALELILDVISNLTVEPYINDNTQLQNSVSMEALAGDLKALQTRNRHLFQMVNALKVIIKSHPTRFDDDQPAFPYTAEFWRDPDGQFDDESELITRKLHVMTGICDKILSELEKDLNKVREERKILQARIATLPQQTNGDKIDTQPQAQPPSSQSNPHAAPEPSVEVWYEGGVKQHGMSQKELDRIREQEKRYYEAATQNKAMAEKIKKQKELARKKQEALEQTATIHIDSDSPSVVMKGDTASFLAVISPQEVFGNISWYLDDQKIPSGANQVNSHVLERPFYEEGIFELKVVLTLHGKFQDQYLHRVTVEAPPQPPQYPPEMEGKKTLALDLKWCRYDTLYQNGNIYLTGHYFTPSGKKVNYTSKPISQFNAMAPAAGLLMTKTAGHHIYQTPTDRSKKGFTYIITRMKGEEVKVLHELTVKKLDIKPAADFSKITVNYVPADGSQNQQIILN